MTKLGHSFRIYIEELVNTVLYNFHGATLFFFSLQKLFITIFYQCRIQDGRAGVLALAKVSDEKEREVT